MATAPKLGLALGAGAARGWSHLGVVQRLAELGIVPDVVAGCSSGAFVGAFVAAGLTERLCVIAREMTWLGSLRMLDWQPPHGGLIRGAQVTELLERELGTPRIEDLPTPFGLSVTELATGRERWMTDGMLAPAVLASMAVPGFIVPPAVDGRHYLDGALTNPVPVSVAKALGADVVVAVALGGELALNFLPAEDRPVARRTAIDEMSQAMGVQMPGQRPEEDPSYLEVVSRSMIIVQNFVTRIRLAAEPADLLLIPEVGSIGLHEFHRADDAIAAGRAAVDDAMAEIGRLAGVSAAR